MRARLVRPEFWDDSLVGAMPDPVRLLYIGLWGLADDAGYLEWDTRSIAMKLYGFQKGSIDAHTRRAEQLVQALVDAGRVELLDCQRHAFIPTLERHRITGGNKSETIKKHHDDEPSRKVRTKPDEPRKPKVRTRPAISRSSSPSLSLSDSLSPSPPRRGNGVKDPNEERREAIARAQAKLDDPEASDDMKRAATFALQQLGGNA